MLRESLDLFRSPRLAHEAHMLVKRARDVLTTGCIVAIRPIGRNSYKIVSLSLSKGYWKAGGVALALRRGDYESIHYALVSPRGFRCTCSNSIRTSSRADAVLERLGLAPTASRFVLCKHVVAALAKLCSMGVISLRSKEVRLSVLRGLGVLYLAIEDPERVRKSAELIKRLFAEEHR
ncbi:MAG: hypothetical protein GXO32_01695 [Crenarchaeota archaeon]|nr:hypothetical protein [Thermoproteota archaeon]